MLSKLESQKLKEEERLVLSDSFCTTAYSLIEKEQANTLCVGVTSTSNGLERFPGAGPILQLPN
jgi:hypothetical protein